jgi:hypothetical protein
MLLRRLIKNLKPYGKPSSLLLRFNGVNSSSVFTDSSPNGLTVTANGGAQISTDQCMFGGSAGYFNGYGAYLRLNHAFDWNSDFTLEMWISRTNIGGYYPTLFEAGDIQGETGGLHLHINNNNNTLICSDGISTSMTGEVITDEKWYHIALVRYSGSNTLFIDGIAVAVSQFNFLVTNNVISIGGAPNYSMWFDGWIDDLRLVPIAVYSNDFIPPSKPVSPYAEQI